MAKILRARGLSHQVCWWCRRAGGLERKEIARPQGERPRCATMLLGSRGVGDCAVVESGGYTCFFFLRASKPRLRLFLAIYLVWLIRLVCVFFVGCTSQRISAQTRLSCPPLHIAYLPYPPRPPGLPACDKGRGVSPSTGVRVRLKVGGRGPGRGGCSSRGRTTVSPAVPGGTQQGSRQSSETARFQVIRTEPGTR